MEISFLKTNRIPILLFMVFTFGTYLRLLHLGAPPLWIDEALFADWTKGIPHQEFPTVLLGKLLPSDEFWLRLPVAICGSLTILFFYRVTGGGWKSLYGSAFIAVFPIFVFWSRVARPYAFAGLFVVLGWRWWGFYIIAILTTPMSLLGLNLFKLKERRYWIYYSFLTLLASSVYYIRPDVRKPGDLMEISFLFTEKRFWYVPILTLLLYSCSRLPDRYFTRDSREEIRRT